MQAVVFWAGLVGVILCYMTLWYGVATRTGRYDVVDSAWGLGFVLTAWLSLALQMNFGLVQVVSATLVSLWGLRLLAHIGRRNWRKHEDDHRYQALVAKWGTAARRKFY